MDFSSIKLGSVVNFNDAPYVITKCDFLRKQQGKPVKKCILKNLITGSNINHSFGSGETVEEADLTREHATFLYRNGDIITFMITSSYETVDFEADLMGDKVDYLKDGLEVHVRYFNDSPISIELPIKISYKITETADVVKGNSVSDVTKDATLETGKVIKVPGFISNGEQIIVNTVEDEYVSRDTDAK